MDSDTARAALEETLDSPVILTTAQAARILDVDFYNTVQGALAQASQIRPLHDVYVDIGAPTWSAVDPRGGHYVCNFRRSPQDIAFTAEKILAMARATAPEWEPPEATEQEDDEDDDWNEDEDDDEDDEDDEDDDDDEF